MQPDNNIPIYEMLKAYRGASPLAFHTPGHFLGRGLLEELKHVGSLDITEIPGSDCLHAPQGAIKEAQEKAAYCFGADYSLFLVNGSTAGIQAMIQSVVEPGGKLILGRDSHISALNTLAQINGEPVFVMPKIDSESQIPLGITVDELRTAIKENPDAQGILITRPNYYGIATSLKDLVVLANENNLALLIDEAHGAHFKFHNNLPKPAMEYGVDLCVQSIHKTLPALTQTAILHGKANGLIDKTHVSRVTSMVQTTSPSYILMSSIDMARSIMEKEGRVLYEKLKILISNFDEQLKKHTCIKRVAQNYKGFDTDFTRIVLSFKNTELSGYKAGELLNTRYGIVIEMADLNNIVLISTPFHTSEDFDKLVLAIKEISNNYGGINREKGQLPQWPIFIPQRIIPLRKALFDKGRKIPIHKSAGCISGNYIIPYPPGIPLVSPGEIINEEIVEYILSLQRENCSVHGIENNHIRIIDL